MRSFLARAAFLAVLVNSILLVSRTRAADSPVTVTDDGKAYTLDNGIVTAMVAKDSGDLISMRYKDTEMLATIMDANGKPDMTVDPSGANGRGFGPFTDHQYGFWSHDAMGPRGTTPAVAMISIDPKSNGGERAEVSIKGISGGRLMGTGPGSSAKGNFISDIDIRWTLGRGESGVYTYCQFEHQPTYDASSITEARFCVKLNNFFDYMSVANDPHHDKYFPKELKEGDKYVYTTDQFDNRAFGWSSTTKNVGFFMINPSMEYMSGGPTKVEFLGHRDTNQVAAPCVLNYWRSSHYGGAEVAVQKGEHWTKVIGPFMLYVTSGDDKTVYQDAREQAKTEAAKWPYQWVKGVDYPQADERSTLDGKLVLNDLPDSKMTHVMAGLTAPAYQSSAVGPTGVGRTVDWQTDAKHYEFWVRGSDDGTFSIPDVRPGKYTLHAFANGVLGELAKTDITVEAGKKLSLGDIEWKPVRYGKELWAIGIPNRNGAEFLGGNLYYTPSIGEAYAMLFPNDITYIVGQSDFTRDWYFQHVPHFDEAATTEAQNRAAEASAAATRAAATQPTGARGRAGGRGQLAFFRPPTPMGKAAPRTIQFDLPDAPHGKAILRIAFSGIQTPFIDVAVNDDKAGRVGPLRSDGVIPDHAIQGIWNEQDLSFDAGMMKKGTNTLTLTIPAGPLTAGVIYDYLRLELDENSTVDKKG